LCPSNWTSIGPYGSPVFAEVIDPGHPETIYTGSEGAGVRKSTDGGETWLPKNNGLPDSIYSMVLDPMHPQTLYATGGGIFKSMNGGENWDLTSGAGSPLVLDPSDPQTIYAGATGGLSKSTDGGATWQRLGNGIVGQVGSIAVDSLHPGTLY